MKSRLPWAAGLLLVGAVALVSGCDDGDSPPPADAAGAEVDTGRLPETDGGTDRPVDTSVATDVPGGGGGDAAVDTRPPTAMKVTLGPAGGTITFHGGRLVVTFPRGSLNRPTEIEVTAVTMPPSGGLGTVYNIDPAQEALARPALIKVKYTAGEIGSAPPSQLKIGRFAEAQWNDLLNTQVNVAPAEQTVTADLNRMGIVALIAGVCEACSVECQLNMPCTTMMDNAAGKCLAFGTACTKCVPTCDGDGDGFCTNSAQSDPNDADINVGPGVPEVCGNNYDDNSNNHADEGCKACASDAECPIGNEACLGGLCKVCEGTCDPANCRFGFVEPNLPDEPGNPGVAGKCFNYGVGCSKCVPQCDVDGDGFCPGVSTDQSIQGGDCDDANRDANPGNPELCGNDIDDDCNGFVDDECDSCIGDKPCPRAGSSCVTGACEGCRMACPVGGDCKLTAPAGEMAPDGVCKAYGNACSKCVPRCDTDGDGFCAGNNTGNPNIQGGDCNDNDPDIYPGALIEICGNGKDDNCNDIQDEGCDACTNDDDCPASHACIGGVCDICNDSCDVDQCRFGAVEPNPPDPGSPGVAGKCFEYGAGKACQKCVPSCDKDGDGYCPGAKVSGQEGGDCLDDNANAHPGAPEVCGNGLDDDCDGLADEECASCNTSMMCPALEACSTKL